MAEFKIDDRVRILVGGPHENLGRIATVGRIQDNGDVVIYFGDQDYCYEVDKCLRADVNAPTELA